jgi:hypothetical protein
MGHDYNPVGFFFLSENRIGVKIEHTHLNKKYSSLEGQFLAQYKNFRPISDFVMSLTF